MSTDKLNALMQEILALPANKVKEPEMPVDIYVQESDDLCAQSGKDADKLSLRKITKKKIASLKLFGAALTEAESQWFIERGKKEEAHQKWQSMSKPAHELKNCILHDFRFAYKNHDDIVAKLRKVGEGNSHSDMIQDLSKLIAVGKEYPEELVAMNFDINLLDGAQEFVDNLGMIYSESKAEDNSSEAKDLRDRAYTCLKIVVDEIRAAGQNLFWKNPDRLKHYRSEYRRHMNIKRNKNKEDDSLAA